MDKLNKKAIEIWREEERLRDMAEEDQALEDCKEKLRQENNKDRAEKVMRIIDSMGLKENHRKIFEYFVEVQCFRKVAKRFGIAHVTVMRLVNKIRARVIESMKNVPLVL